MSSNLYLITGDEAYEKQERLEQIKENKFAILDTIKDVANEENLQLTLSIPDIPPTIPISNTSKIFDNENEKSVEIIANIRFIESAYNIPLKTPFSRPLSCLILKKQPKNTDNTFINWFTTLITVVFR